MAPLRIRAATTGSVITIVSTSSCKWTFSRSIWNVPSSAVPRRHRGYLWGRKPDAMARLRAWAFEGGPPVAHEDYYLRAQPTFETPKGPHDWLTRHVFIGVGERKPDGNLVRYYALT